MMVLWWVTVDARAWDDVIDFQLESEDVLAALVHHGKSVGRDCPEIIHDGGFGDIVVDRLDWDEYGLEIVRGDPITVSLSGGDLTVSPPIARIPVRLVGKPLSCIHSTSSYCGGYDNQTITLSYRLDASPQGLCARFVDAEGGSGTFDDVVTDVIDRFGEPCVDPYEVVAPLLGVFVDDWAVVDALAVTGTDGARIEVRASISGGPYGSPAWQPYWDAFALNANPGSSDLTYTRLGEAMVLHAFEDDVAAAVTSAGLDLGPYEVTTWASAGSYGNEWTSTVDIEGDCAWTLGGDLTLTTYLNRHAYPHGGSSTDYAAYDYELELETHIDLQEGGLWTVDCDGAPEAIRSRMDDRFADLGGACDLDGTTVTCAMPVPIVDLDFGGGGVDVAPYTTPYTPVVVNSDWTTLYGRAYPFGAEVEAPITVSVETPEYAVRKAECSATAGYLGSLNVTGGPGEFCPAPDLGVPTPTVTGDDLGVFDVTSGGEVRSVPITLSGDLASYFADPYAAKIVYWSTVGSGTVSVPSPKEYPLPLGYDPELLQAVAEAWANCHPATDGVPIPGYFDIHWLIDPGPIEVTVVGAKWQGATAKLASAGLQQLGESTYDEKNGITLLPSKSATLSSKWELSSRDGALSVSLGSALANDWMGVPYGRGTLLTPTADGAVKFDVPREQLPEGVSSMSFSVQLAPGDVVATGTLTGR